MRGGLQESGLQHFDHGETRQIQQCFGQSHHCQTAQCKLPKQQSVFICPTSKIKPTMSATWRVFISIINTLLCMVLSSPAFLPCQPWLHKMQGTNCNALFMLYCFSLRLNWRLINYPDSLSWKKRFVAPAQYEFNEIDYSFQQSLPNALNWYLILDKHSGHYKCSILTIATLKYKINIASGLVPHKLKILTSWKAQPKDGCFIDTLKFTH